MSGPDVPPPPPGGPPHEPAGGRPRRPVELRPMGVGELLDGAIKLYLANWATFMGIVAVVVVPFGLLQALFATPPDIGGTAPAPAPGGAALVLGLVEGLLVFTVVEAAMAKTAADVYLGEPIGIARTYRFAVPLIGSLLWVVLLAGLAVLGGFILLIVPGVFLLLRFYFALIVVVVEGERGAEAMRRSWRLVKGSTWRVLGITLLLALIAGVAQAILAAPFGIAGFVTETFALAIVGDVVASVLVTPLVSLVTVLLYFDLRVRKEGFDLELLARALGPVGEPGGGAT